MAYLVELRHAGAMSSGFGYRPDSGQQLGAGQPYGDSPYSQPGWTPVYGSPDSGPYGYGSPPPAPYGPAPPAMPGGYPPREHPQGTTILVLGILGLSLCFICSIVALVMGKHALAEIDANPAAYSNRGTVRAGQTCALIGIIIAAVVIGSMILVNVVPLIMMLALALTAG